MTIRSKRIVSSFFIKFRALKRQNMKRKLIGLKILLGPKRFMVFGLSGHIASDIGVSDTSLNSSDSSTNKRKHIELTKENIEEALDLDPSEVKVNESMASYFDSEASASELQILRDTMADPTFALLPVDVQEKIKAKYTEKILKKFC